LLEALVNECEYYVLNWQFCLGLGLRLAGSTILSNA